ncbi:MAG: hypothetical protein NTY61_02940 [Candidatus Parcubacteria bacterium]|nr:hypothetical protein [Candidatus Parcubacteria bacterium]
MKKYLLMGTLAASLLLPILVSAQDMTQGLGQFQNETGLTNADLTTVIGRIVKIVIGFLGLIAVVIILIGGFQWMTSAGDEDKIKGAKGLMTNGVIGLFIVVIAYAIALFVMNIIGRVIAPGS